MATRGGHPLAAHKGLDGVEAGDGEEEEAVLLHDTLELWWVLEKGAGGIHAST